MPFPLQCIDPAELDTGQILKEGDEQVKEEERESETDHIGCDKYSDIRILLLFKFEQLLLAKTIICILYLFRVGMFYQISLCQLVTSLKRNIASRGSYCAN